MPVDLDAIRKRHVATIDPKAWCDECTQFLPCDTIQLADEVERQKDLRIKEGFEANEIIERLREALDAAGVTFHLHVTHGLTRNEAHQARDACFSISRADLNPAPASNPEP